MIPGLALARDRIDLEEVLDRCWHDPLLFEKPELQRGSAATAQAICVLARGVAASGTGVLPGPTHDREGALRAAAGAHRDDGAFGEHECVDLQASDAHTGDLERGIDRETCRVELTALAAFRRGEQLA